MQLNFMTSLMQDFDVIITLLYNSIHIKNTIHNQYYCEIIQMSLLAQNMGDLWDKSITNKMVLIS